MALVGVKQLSLSFPIFGCSSNPRMPAISPNNFPSSSSTYSPFQFQNIQVLKSRNPKWFTSRIHCSANSGPITQKNAIVKERSVSVILLAGGKGKRMGADMPKQYLPLLGQPIALYSLYTFSQMVEVKEIVVVCDPSYKDIFEDTKDKIHVDLRFTEPGKERQDSVYNGLQAIDSDAELVCIHDSARPLVYSQDVEKVLKDGWLHGAAVLGVPVKATIKEASNKSFVVKTLDRKTLWEMQTPQVIKPALLKEGFDLVNRKRKEVQGAPENDSSNELAINDIAYDIFSENADDVSIVEHLGHRVKGLEVTDDVSIVEHLGHPVFITEGSYTNIKITTPDDLLLAERILNPRPSS